MDLKYSFLQAFRVRLKAFVSHLKLPMSIMKAFASRLKQSMSTMKAFFTLPKRIETRSIY
jgi:hypothetical protein